jgi:hypothetical protein
MTNQPEHRRLHDKLYSKVGPSKVIQVTPKFRIN